MNYLAHLYLSGSEPDIRVGNFIGDYVKGQQFKRYPPHIQTGIILHRHIDTFTDQHTCVRESISLFKEGYGRYSGVAADIVYDHLLARHWRAYSSEPLSHFVNETHRILIHHYFGLPWPVKQFLPFLINSRRLESYQSLEGIEKTLSIMSKHSSFPNRSKWAVGQIASHYTELEQQFHAFFPQMQASAKSFLDEHSISTGSDHPIPA